MGEARRRRELGLPPKGKRFTITIPAEKYRRALEIPVRAFPPYGPADFHVRNQRNEWARISDAGLLKMAMARLAELDAAPASDVIPLPDAATAHFTDRDDLPDPPRAA